MNETKKMPETLAKIAKSVPEYGLYLAEDGYTFFHPAWPQGVWNIGDVRDIDSRRRATENELKHYLTQIDATNNWDETREKVWSDCSSLGPAGTKEKEKAIQDLLVQKGVAL